MEETAGKKLGQLSSPVAWLLGGHEYH